MNIGGGTENLGGGGGGGVNIGGGGGGTENLGGGGGGGENIGGGVLGGGEDTLSAIIGPVPARAITIPRSHARS